MFYVISCVLLLFSTLSIALPLPYPAPQVSGLPTIVASTTGEPTSFSLAPTPVQGSSSYNSPYYNYAGGPVVPILSYYNEHGPDGTYAFSFSTGDGKQAQENGFLKDAYIDDKGEPKGTQVVHGSYSYISPEGTPIHVTYVADENGFRPSGVHIPADGKTTGILPVIDKTKQPLDSQYNRYDPYYTGNRYVPSGQNNNYRTYDPRYPYDPKYPYDLRYRHDSKYSYDPRYPYDSTKYNPYFNNSQQIAEPKKNDKEEDKKESA